MVWEWQAWRCFDNIKETFEEKGWSSGLLGLYPNEAMPLLAESDGHYISFFERDPATGECWFEMGDKARRTVVFLQGVESIPAPERAAGLLAGYGTPLGEMRNARDLPLHALPLAPQAAAKAA